MRAERQPRSGKPPITGSSHAVQSSQRSSQDTANGAGPYDAPVFRLLIQPDAGNSLDAPSRIMTNKITNVRRSRLGTKTGVLDDAKTLRLWALVVFPGHRRQHMSPPGPTYLPVEAGVAVIGRPCAAAAVQRGHRWRRRFPGPVVY